MPEPLAVRPQQPLNETEAPRQQEPEAIPELAVRQITETEVRMQVAPEEEKPDMEIAVTQTAEPELAELYDIMPDQAAHIPSAETIVDQPPAIREEPIIRPAVVSEQPVDAPAAVQEAELPAIEPTETALTDEIPEAYEVTISEAVHESAPDLSEADSITTLPDIDQTDEEVFTEEFFSDQIVDEAIVPLPEHIMQQLDETMASHFEQLEPAERENTLVILRDITEVIREIGEARHASDPEKFALTEKDLTELSQELFESMHLEPEQEVIRWFVEQLMNYGILIGQEQPGADSFMEEGTHEQLQAYFQTLGQLLKLMKSSLSPLQRLGRLAVGLKLVPA